MLVQAVPNAVAVVVIIVAKTICHSVPPRRTVRGVGKKEELVIVPYSLLIAITSRTSFTCTVYQHGLPLSIEATDGSPGSGIASDVELYLFDFVFVLPWGRLGQCPHLSTTANRGNAVPPVCSGFV